MVDTMVEKTQRWLNETYEGRPGFGYVMVDGQTGWNTIYALTRALQIELGITETANNFGPGTQARFQARWPSGIQQQKDGDKTTSNVYGIIQGALWCKGYWIDSSKITTNFYGSTGDAIRKLKSDMGIGGDSSVGIGIMKALLSMDQFVLLVHSGGRATIRQAQQLINRNYQSYVGIIPTDGLYGREMNTALITVLQAIEGLSPDEATGNFGPTTRKKLMYINSANAMLYPRWLWLGTVALACNGYDVNPSSSSVWDGSVSTAVKAFQHDYALEPKQHGEVDQYGVFDRTTWMSLLTSKGDPDRPCVACDTRFEVTDELIKYLKADGYQIVGRYLTEPGQEDLQPSEYFKAIRPGELQRIVSAGLGYFPIFQERSTRLTDFSAYTGSRHGQEAVAQAKKLGIPPAPIYFAVDFDATDPEVTSNILPYFRAVSMRMRDGYSVGIYASRNICTRVVDAGYASSVFVSDMSSGFSGNLGFPIPSEWNYDQFTEIQGYRGSWDLDRVAWSGRHAPCRSVNAGNVPPISVGYTVPPQASAADLAKAGNVVEFISLVRELEKVMNSTPSVKTSSTTVLNYLSKFYLKGDEFSQAVMSYNHKFGDIVERDYPYLARRLDSFVSNLGGERTDVKDSIGGMIDLAHMLVAATGYCVNSKAPDHWIGWGGDLATGMCDLHDAMLQNPKYDIQQMANAIIGAASYTASYLYCADMKDIPIQCNFSDLCSDADAIAISTAISRSDNAATAVSNALDKYYKSVTWPIRFRQFMHDVEFDGSLKSLQTGVYDAMNGLMENFALVDLPIFSDFPKGLIRSKAKGTTDKDKVAASNAFGSYVWSMIHR